MGTPLEHVCMQPASSLSGDKAGNVGQSISSLAAVILHAGSSFAGKGPGNPGGQQVKHKLALRPCNKESQLLLD